MSRLTQEQLKAEVRYFPRTGTFLHALRNQIVTQQDAQGYNLLVIDGKSYRAGRMAWLYMTGEYPKGYVDHKDRVRNNDAWENLRDITPSQNSANQTYEGRKPKSGFTGVYRGLASWYALITVEGRKIRLGSYPTPELASEAYQTARQKYFGEFNPI
jgi:hypothetical protein